MFPLAAIFDIGSKLIDKLIPDPEAKAKAQLDLAKMQHDGELTKMANETKLYEAEQIAVTARWEADMGSDSWLSKNIRPMALIAPSGTTPKRATSTCWGNGGRSSSLHILAAEPWKN